MSQTETVYLDGNYTQKNEAKLSILDRGFLFGDGVYELIPVYNRYIFYIENHLKRLKSSLNLINIDSSIIDDIQIIEIIKDLISKNNYIDRKSVV